MHLYGCINQSYSSIWCITFTGPAIPKAHHSENVGKILGNLLYAKTGIRIDYKNWSQIHRIGNGQIIVEFNDRQKFSPFDRLLNHPASFGGSHPHLNLYWHLRLSEEDSNILKKAKELKSNGKIDRYDVNSISGRVDITTGGMTKPMFYYDDILQFDESTSTSIMEALPEPIVVNDDETDLF